MKVGLRIDVDTFRGTRYGVPTLCRILREHGIRATFFFTVGPDNMGRHLWRLLKPAFLWKMLRTNAGSLYGWDILLCGTFWPGPAIGRKLGPVIASAAEAGHEIGLHAWDHHAWQKYVEQMSPEALHEALRKGYEMLEGITGTAPVCSAVPGWRCTDAVLLEKERFPFTYNSDCRGEAIFRPEVDGRPLTQPQVPVTLPTYDEVVGRDGITRENYNDHLLGLLQPEALNVLTIHTEVEGMSCSDLFEDFLRRAKAAGAEFLALGDLVRQAGTLPPGRVALKNFSGREGRLAQQVAA